ncbi:MAG: T9SS type A sorting domain-containing protein [Chlorobi bacterium]|nr:T9SS type A sorting domain-containing protein [Chlorobiota bacterium]
MKKLLSVVFVFILSLTITAQDLMTIGKVFDFEIGDEFQTSGYADTQPPNADRITIINKYYSPDSNTVFYVRFHDSYYVYVENNESFYHFWTETDTVSYTDLDSCITYYKYWPSYDTSMIEYDTINFISEDYCDSLINGYYYVIGSFEPAYYSKSFGKGLGLVEDYYNNPAEFQGFYNKLFYYKKNGIGCGTPDTLVSSVSEMYRKNEIKIYPNPANKSFVIEYGSLKNPEMKIYNTSGELLDSRILNKNNTFYDCSLLRPGIYFIWFSTGSERYCKKLIIK